MNLWYNATVTDKRQYQLHIHYKAYAGECQQVSSNIAKLSEGGQGRGTAEKRADDQGNGTGIHVPGIRHPHACEARGNPRHTGGNPLLYHAARI